MFRIILLLLLFPINTLALESRRESKVPEVRVCTQNLNRLNPEKRNARTRKTLLRLEERIRSAACDVVAVQEVVGRDELETRETLSQIAKYLSASGSMTFVPFVGSSRDSYIGNGFLVRESLAEGAVVKSFSSAALPKLQVRAASRQFTRGPLALRIRVPGQGAARARGFVIINAHFKSKANGWKDPNKLQFETVRMEMAAALRGIGERFLRSDGTPTVVIVGDFNSRDDSASFAILRGERSLGQFRSMDGCRVEKSLAPVCPAMVPREQTRFVPGFSLARTTHHTVRGASYRYRRKLELIDNMLVDEGSAWLIREGSDVQGGVVGTFGGGLDHKLLWLEFNW